MPRKKYKVVLADPPWVAVTWKRPWNRPYDTLSLEQLSAIPVKGWVADDACLFMWVVDKHLEECFALGRAWGFQFKTRVFTWCKMTSNGKRVFGTGGWTRRQAEICLLFVRGKPKRQNGGVREIIESVRREHSRKPDEQYERIEALCAGPYLEMFARQARSGWDCWGNETGKFNVAPKS